MVTTSSLEATVYFLNRAVSKLTLPLISGRPGPEAPKLKRLALPQGELAQFWSGDQGMRYIAMMELRSGNVRGNHFHEKKCELVYIISGSVELLVEDPSTRDRHAIILQPGDLATINPGIAHALRVLSTGCGVEFSPEAFDPSDSFSYPLA